MDINRTLSVAMAGLVALTSTAPLPGEGPGDAEPKLCHTAGEGFSLKFEDRMVLMDALYREGYPEDQLPSEAMMARMETAAAPYDEVDLVTVSHRHIDHFGVASILKFMEYNPGAHLLLPREAAAELAAAGGGRFAERIRAVTPKRGYPQTLEINGITVTVFNLDHRTDVENIGIMVTLGGKTYFHLGDFSSAEFEANAVSGIAVDYLLAPYWYLRNEQNFTILTENIRADYLIPMHLPRPDPPDDFIERVGSFAGLMATIASRSDKVRMLYEEGACLEGTDDEPGPSPFGQLAPSAPPETGQFAFLIGEWDCKTRFMGPDQSWREGAAKWSGRYELDGWAIRDDWVTRRPGGNDFHGFNIRSFNPETRKWDNRWLAQGTLQWKYFEAEKHGETMVMIGGEGKDANGEFIDRNTFYDIGPDSWKWRKDRSWDGGETWFEGIGFIEATRAE